jgi:hypothetical protein
MFYLTLVVLLGTSLAGAGPVLYRLDGDREAELVKIPVSSTGALTVTYKNVTKCFQ